MARKSNEQISYNMSRVRSWGTVLEDTLCAELTRRGFLAFTRNDKSIYGKPDFVFRAKKLAVFCDSEFWHGYDWFQAQNEIKSNRDFWIPKIEKTIARDKNVTARLSSEGWTVLRFWGNQIKEDVAACVKEIEAFLRAAPASPLRTIDLCAGIGGIRRGFERAGGFENILSCEIDKYACMTYEHIFGENPHNDVTSADFKSVLEQTSYDVLLAGFPCQTFSHVGRGEGFADEEKGKIFFHIVEIIERTRPCALFLENVDHLVRHDKGYTFKTIIETLEVKLQYKLIGVTVLENGSLAYQPNDFIRNSRDFGVPQNRPRTYIIGFDRERFAPEKLRLLPTELPVGRQEKLYNNLNDVLERDVPAGYYMSSGYLATLELHRARQQARGYGFGYRIVNEPGIENPIANTLLATGGSGRERNLIWDPREGIEGTVVKRKKTPLNGRGIRVMTPTEWGKLQGFINYAFLREDGKDSFSFPTCIPNVQKYKQFGNSVTIPVIEEMAFFIQRCLEILSSSEEKEVLK